MTDRATTTGDARAGPAEVAKAERPTVLVVEDDEDVRDTFHDVLEDEGYDVLVASNGREALDVLGGGARPSVVLLDLMMPVMNGWQMLETLRADGELSKIPVVVVSAVGHPTSLPPGARSFLPKPVSVATLLAAVERHCRFPYDA